MSILQAGREGNHLTRSRFSVCELLRDELRVRFNERVAGSDDARRDVVCIIKLRVNFVRVNFDARQARIGVE